MRTLTHIDLFSGIGGFTLAAQAAGFETIAFSEIDPYASQILAKHWPKIPNLGDLRTAEWGGYSRRDVSLLTGGFPCQPFSSSGKRRGRDDDRDLWPSMLSVVKTIRPNWVVGENVTNFINMELARSITDLENAGYSVQPLAIPACAIGAPHERERIWIVANANEERRERKEISMQQWSGLPDATRKINAAADAEQERCERREQDAIFRKPAEPRKFERGFEEWAGGWSVSAPVVCGVDDGIPERIHRTECLGNAIVPQVAEVILKAIYQIETQNK